MNITIKTIPHSEQRYPTAGDYWFDGDNLEIRISDVGNWKHELLVAIHEIAEVALCKERGITIANIDHFDMNFEADNINHSKEPGDDSKSPYQNEHNLATGVERIMCSALNVKWEEYDGALDKLF